MNDILTAVGIGVVVFATTNIDDILLLAAFFSDPRMAARNIVAGQFLGIGVLILGSTLAALLALVVPEAWIALLGIVPLSLGIRRLIRLHKATDSEEPPASSAHSQVVTVALVTMANGGDNLGIYIPLFAKNLALVPTYVAVFAVMTAAWCGMGYWLTRHRLIGRHIRRWGHVLLPFVLMGLGLWILSGALTLFR